MMTLTLTPEQERRLRAKAERRQKPVEVILDEWLTDRGGVRGTEA